MSDRRRTWREYATRQREKEMEARRAGRHRCPRRFGRFGLCDARLEVRTDGNGGAHVVCPECERLARGICADCPRPVVGTIGKARRCAECRRKANRASMRRSGERHREENNRRDRARYNEDAEIRRRRNNYKKLWRLANPDKVAAQKQREKLHQSPSRAAYHKRYRSKRRRQRAVHALDVYHGRAPVRLCPECGETVLTGKRRKCDACKETAREFAVALLQSCQGRGRRTDLERMGI